MGFFRIIAAGLILNFSAMAIEESIEKPNRQTQAEMPQTSKPKNGLFASVGVLNLFVTPSVGYLRFLTDRIFLTAYLNYSYADVPDVLSSFKYNSRKNIDSERTAYLVALGPEFVFHEFNWAGAKTLLFGGILVGYYSFSVNLKPGIEGGGRPTPPASVSGAESWRGLAAVANIGIHATVSDAIFCILAFGVILGQTRDVAYEVVETNGAIVSGVYKNYSGNYSFTPQITIGMGISF